MTKRFAGLATLLFLALPAVALAADESGDEEKFNPASEWTLHEWIPIHLGPIDMSINKAVAYLLLGALLSCLIGILFMRVKVGSEPNRRQALGETIYEVAQVQVAEQGLPTKAIGRWFPYVASLMIFIWVDQHARLHPAAALGREGHDRGGEGADARALRGDVDALRHAGAGADDVRLHARRGHPRERRV